MLLSRASRPLLLGLSFGLSGVLAQNASTTSASNHTTVLILGGGMTGIIAAQSLHQQGVDDFIILDAKTELGGRMIQKAFGVSGNQVVVEMGPAWIKGTQQGNDTANPIWQLALKHNLSTVYNDIYGSVTTYDDTGYNNYTSVFNDAINKFTQMTVPAGQRIVESGVDLSLRTAYGMLGLSPRSPQEIASDYYQIDFSASQMSWLAAAWKHNFTYVPAAGGYSNVHQMSVDPRGIVYIAQAEAAEFLQPNQVIYNQTVNLIEWGGGNVTVQTTGGMTITAEHVLCTFSAGVLQNTDVVFQPPLPDWKKEAVNSITMATFTKIFLQFNDTFWFPTEMGLYASKHAGRYPVWQSLDHVGFFPGSGIVIVTVTGDWSIYVEQLTTQEVQAEVMEVLRAMYPNITVPDPIDIHVPLWATNSLYRGSYPAWGPSYIPDHSENLSGTLNNHLWFAGDYTTVRYFGTLQGAYSEGQRTGNAIAACVQGTATCQVPNATVPQNIGPYQTFVVSPVD